MLFVPLFWGGAFGVTKHVLTELPPLTASAVRFLMAGLLMAGWAAWRGEWNLRSVRGSWLGLIGLGATGVLGYNLFFAVGMQYTSAINGALVVVINPVTTALVAVLFLGERWSWRLGLGIVLSLTGVLTVITRGDPTALQSISLNKGELLMLGAVASWTTYTSLGKIVMRRVSPTMATVVSTLLGTGMLVLASLTETGWKSVPQVSGQVAAELLYLAVFASFVAFLLYNIGVREIGASKASSYINLMPVNALWIAAVLYGEVITLPQVVGMLFVVSGVFVTTRAPGGQKNGGSK
jgi:drug/metabolite transporter (DMT)-like permease